MIVLVTLGKGGEASGCETPKKWDSREIRQQLDNEVVRQQWDNKVVRKTVVGQPIFAMSLGGTGQPISAILEGRIVQSNLAILLSVSRKAANPCYLSGRGGTTHSCNIAR